MSRQEETGEARGDWIGKRRQRRLERQEKAEETQGAG